MDRPSADQIRQAMKEWQEAERRLGDTRRTASEDADALEAAAKIERLSRGKRWTLARSFCGTFPNGVAVR